MTTRAWLLAASCLVLVFRSASAEEGTEQPPLGVTTMNVVSHVKAVAASAVIISGPGSEVANSLTRGSARPRPRPHLGGGDAIENQAGARTADSRPAEQARAYLGALIYQICDRWDFPIEPAEPPQLVHPLEVEGVVVVDKRDGSLAVESLHLAPDSEAMNSFRQWAAHERRKFSAGETAFAATPQIADRFRRFIRSLPAVTIPDELWRLPGDSLRIRLTFNETRIGSATYTEAPPAGDAAGSTRAQPPAEAPPASSIPHARAISDPLDPENVRRHADIADPVYQCAVGLRYLNGTDGWERNPKLAEYWLTKAAEQGFARAQAQLGLMYQTSMGVPRDPIKAMEWYQKAADQGDTMALDNLGVMWANGDNGYRDPAEAAKWFRKAAELGDLAGAQSLAYAYLTGDGVPQDLAESFKWYLSAARRGVSFAQYKVGDMYEHGLGVRQDLIEALAWYNLAPTSGLADETNHRDRLEALLPPESARRARQRADELRQSLGGQSATK